MMNIQFRLAIVVLFFVLMACNPKLPHTPVSPMPPAVPPHVTSTPKNVILMIGDGMGLGQITAGMLYQDEPLHLENIKHIGFHKSSSADDLITDSAAGATAFSCGIKTYNGAIGVDTDTLPVTTILELAAKGGYKTGLIATSTIVHATPASFFSHNRNRSNYEEIALDMLDGDVDFFIGGGRKFFNRRTIDDRDLYAELGTKGYKVADFVNEDIATIHIDRAQKFGFFTADKDPLPVSQGRNYLLPAVDRGLQYMEGRDKGFFMMIEGSQIDWGGHANNAQYIITEMQEFDKAIGSVLAWAKSDGETLVIITADHETGGFAINKGSTRDSIVAGFTSDYHTATMIPVFAYGPGAEHFQGIYPNTSIFDKMKQLLKLTSKQ